MRSNMILYNNTNDIIPQITLTKQFAGHLAYYVNVEFLVANTTYSDGRSLQPEDDRYPLRGGCFKVYRTGSHRRRWHDIYIFPWNFNQVR